MTPDPLILFGRKAIWHDRSSEMDGRIPPTRKWWPTCAVCGKPVEKMIRSEDPGMRFIVFTAECHGATEETRVGFDQVANDKDFLKNLHGGDAFKSTLLPGPVTVNIPMPLNARKPRD